MVAWFTGMVVADAIKEKYGNRIMRNALIETFYVSISVIFCLLLLEAIV